MLGCCLFVTTALLSTDYPVRAQEQRPNDVSVASAKSARENGQTLQPIDTRTNDAEDAASDQRNSLGLSFLKNLLSDQRSIWTSPLHLRSSDVSWLLPLATVTGGLLATDKWTAKGLSNDPTTLNRYRSFSDAGLAALAGAGGSLFLWGKITHDDHQRETGILAGEAAIDSLAAGTGLQYAFGRERPYQSPGNGTFLQGGTSFPSDHAAVAWSVASVIAHEYPGVLSQVFVYGLATAVTASRVMGQEHFPSDVVVGSAIGWLIGRQVYRAHHDRKLGGATVNVLDADEDENRRSRQRMGSPFVPLDSWVYPAFEQLIALGYVSSAIMGLKPWTRMECARLTDEAGEKLQGDEIPHEDLVRLQVRLQEEFAYELDRLGGGHNVTANIESLYTRVVSISGPAITDGFHFGQTISYDFGRPFERGTNGQVGGSFSAATGPLTLYVRAEYQHAPSAAALSDTARNFISSADMVPLSHVPAGPVAAINRSQLLDAYVAVNLNNWQFVVGRQSLSWTPAPDGSLLWSDNIEPVTMVRLVNPEPFVLPGFLRHLGPLRVDQFIGRLAGHSYISGPFIYGQKLNFKPFAFLEIGLGRTTTIGGAGGVPFTPANFLRSLVGNRNPQTDNVPGDSHSEVWLFQSSTTTLSYTVTRTRTTTFCLCCHPPTHGGILGIPASTSLESLEYRSLIFIWKACPQRLRRAAMACTTQVTSTIGTRAIETGTPTPAI